VPRSEAGIEGDIGKRDREALEGPKESRCKQWPEEERKII
jgi:hypothetical protein